MIENFIKKNQLIIFLLLDILYLGILICFMFFKKEYNDPTYNYLVNNWLMKPIMDIKIKNEKKITKINKLDNQNNLGYFKFSNDLSKDINSWEGKTLEIILHNSYYYPNFFNFAKLENKKLCGKDSQNNEIYIPSNENCPINYIEITNETYSKINCELYKCKSYMLNNGKKIYFSNNYISGYILVQLRVSYENGICDDFNSEIGFNLINIDNSNSIKCKEGIDNSYNKIDTEKLINFIQDNNINDINIKNNNSNIYLYYRSYVGVNNLSLFTEHSIDHITYSKKISEVKNTILFISWILYLFLSLFLYLKKINVKRKWINYTLIIFFVITIIFNFLFCVHVCGVFLRVKGIIKTVDLEGLKYYKTGFKWFIYLNCLIEIGLILDFIFKFNQYKIGKNDINIIINNNLSLIK